MTDDEIATWSSSQAYARLVLEEEHEGHPCGLEAHGAPSAIWLYVLRVQVWRYRQVILMQARLSFKASVHIVDRPFAHVIPASTFSVWFCWQRKNRYTVPHRASPRIPLSLSAGNLTKHVQPFPWTNWSNIRNSSICSMFWPGEQGPNSLWTGLSNPPGEQGLNF